MARTLDTTSMLDQLRVLAGTGVARVDYRTVTLRLPTFAKHAVINDRRRRVRYGRAASGVIGTPRCIHTVLSD